MPSWSDPAIRPVGEPRRSGSRVTGDGRRLAWSEWGPRDGIAVVLLHGAPGSSHACPDEAAVEALGVRLIAPDRPGYGASEPQPGRTLRDWAFDLGGLLDTLEVEAAPTVAWSSGVPFGLAAAHALGARVTALELIAGDAPYDELPDPPPDGRERVARVRADPAGSRSEALERLRWFADDPESILDQAPDPVVTADRPVASLDPDARLRTRADVRAMLREMFRHAGRSGAEGLVDDSVAIALPWGFTLAEVTQRVTVWFGTEDRLAERGDSEFLARTLPHARLELVEDTGHLLPVTMFAVILRDALGPPG